LSPDKLPQRPITVTQGETIEQRFDCSDCCRSGSRHPQSSRPSSRTTGGCACSFANHATSDHSALRSFTLTKLAFQTRRANRQKASPFDVATAKETANAIGRRRPG